MQNATRNNFLADFPSSKFNSELNNDVSNCLNCPLCDRKDFNFNEDIPLKIICYSFVRNLGILQERKSKDNYENNMFCNHLIHWMYNKYFNIDKGKNYKDFYVFFNKFDSVRNYILSFNSSDNDFCKDVISKNLSFEEISKRKNYNDYYVNFKFIEEALTKKKEDCYKYYDYLKGMTTAYSNMVKECPKHDNEKYCENINYKECDPEVLLKLPKCKEIQDKEEKETEESFSTEPKYIWKYCDNLVINYSDYRAIFIIGLAIWGLILSLFFLYNVN